MLLFGQDIFVLLVLLLAFLMTMLSLYTYLKYEKAEKLLNESKGHLDVLRREHEEFRLSASEAFGDRKSLELRIQELERSLGMAHEEAQRAKDSLVRAAEEHQRMKKELESTRENLRVAYANLREREGEVLRLKEELSRTRT